MTAGTYNNEPEYEIIDEKFNDAATGNNDYDFVKCPAYSCNNISKQIVNCTITRLVIVAVIIHSVKLGNYKEIKIKINV